MLVSKSICDGLRFCKLLLILFFIKLLLPFLVQNGASVTIAVAVWIGHDDGGRTGTELVADLVGFVLGHALVDQVLQLAYARVVLVLCRRRRRRLLLS